MISFILLLYSVTLCEDPAKLEEAESLIGLGKFWEAYVILSYLTSPDHRHEGSSRLYHLHALSSMGLKRYREVLDDTEILLSRPMPSLDRNSVYILQAKAHSQLGDFAAAHQSAEKAKDPTLLQEFLELEGHRVAAELLVNESKFEEAARLYDGLLQRFPEAPTLLFARANLSWLLADYDHFLKLSGGLVWQFSSDGLLLYRRGLVALCQTHYNAALKAFLPARALEGVAEKATEAYAMTEEIKELDRRLDSKVQGKPLTSQSRGKFEELRAKAEKYCWDGSYLMNQIFMRDLELMGIEKEKNERKLAVLKEYIERAPKFAELYLMRGDIYLEEGQFDEAILDFEEAERCGAQFEAGLGLRKAVVMREQATNDQL